MALHARRPPNVMRLSCGRARQLQARVRRRAAALDAGLTGWRDSAQVLSPLEGECTRDPYARLSRWF
jgi:hypothetical protein